MQVRMNEIEIMVSYDVDYLAATMENGSIE